MKKIVNTIVCWMLPAVEIQLFISLVSLPILISWGMPISLLAILGNIIFIPFLCITLFISSLLFFCTIIHIPTTPLVWILDTIGNFWHFCMNVMRTNSCIVAFRKPPLPIFLLIIGGIACTTVCIKHCSRVKRITFFVLAFILIGLLTKASVQEYLCMQIPCKKKSCTLLHTTHSTSLIDVDGCLTCASPSWVQYELAPTIIQTTGTTTLEHVVIGRPSITSLRAAQALMHRFYVKYLYIPTINGSSSASYQQEWCLLISQANNTECIIVEINTTVDLPTHDHAKLSIVPLDKYGRINNVSYRKLSVVGQIDNTSFTLYPPQ